MSMAFPAILSNFFVEEWTQNHPQYLSGLSRALFPTTFLEIAVYREGRTISHVGGVGQPWKKKWYSTCKGKLTKEMRKRKLIKEMREWLTKINSCSSKIIYPRHNKCVCSSKTNWSALNVWVLLAKHFNQGVWLRDCTFILQNTVPIQTNIL